MKIALHRLRAPWARLCCSAFLVLGACTGGPSLPACGGAMACRISLVTGPGDDSYVPEALEATARAFLTPAGDAPDGAGSATGPAGPPSADGGGFSGSWLRLDRDTLSPRSSTPHQVTRNRSLGLRAEISHRLGGNLHSYGALSVVAGQHDYLLPQGLGPLVDPMRISMRTYLATPEIGLQYDMPLPYLQTVRLRAFAGAGRVYGRTQTKLNSALLDVPSRNAVNLPYVTLGAGVGLDPPGPGRLDVISSARMGRGGAAVMRTEMRLSH